MKPGADDFRTALRERLLKAQGDGIPAIEVKSGDLHREVGGYPDNDHRMPICCDVMRREIAEGDTILHESPSGKGANLLIRYMLPRKPS